MAKVKFVDARERNYYSKVSLGKPRNYTIREFPKLGEPGGRDDPLRKGLSGAGARKYLRYLTQGIAPEAARKRVLEEREKRERQHTVFYEPNFDDTSSGDKRNSEHILPHEHLEKKKKITSTSNVTQSITLNTHKMGILPKEYPQIVLTAEELSALEDSLVEEMMTGTTEYLHFTGIHFRSGMLLVECENETTVTWLIETVPQLKKWEGPELMVCGHNDIPKSYTITMYLPRSKDKEVEALLKLIRLQNPELKTETWRIISSKRQCHGKVLVLGIDAKSKEVIIKQEHTIHYRFGKVAVFGLKKKQEKPEPAAQQEMETGFIGWEDEAMLNKEETIVVSGEALGGDRIKEKKFSTHDPLV